MSGKVGVASWPGGWTPPGYVLALPLGASGTDSKLNPGQAQPALDDRQTGPSLRPLLKDRPASLAERSSHCFPALRKTNCQVIPVIATRLIPHWIKARSRSVREGDEVDPDHRLGRRVS